MNDDQGLKLAFDAAHAGVAEGQAPSGAAVVRDADDAVLAACGNATAGTNDPTQHAELRAIQLACALTGSLDLSGCTLYATCEPCVMCLGAIHWAKLGWLIHAATIEDAAAAGLPQLPLPAHALASQAKMPLRLRGPVDRTAGRALFEIWNARR